MISEWSTIIGFCSMMIAKLLGLLPLERQTLISRDNTH